MVVKSDVYVHKYRRIKRRLKSDTNEISSNVNVHDSVEGLSEVYSSTISGDSSLGRVKVKINLLYIASSTSVGFHQEMQ